MVVCNFNYFNIFNLNPKVFAVIILGYGLLARLKN